MVNEIRTIEDRKNSLIKKGKENGYVTYEQMAEELKGLEVDSDTLDDLYNTFIENKILDAVNEYLLGLHKYIRIFLQQGLSLRQIGC